MKKALFILLVLLPALGLAACGVPVSTKTTSQSAPAGSSGVVTFADPMLESKVRFST